MMAHWLPPTGSRLDCCIFIRRAGNSVLPSVALLEGPNYCR
jgi:hypothetical protein